MDAPWNSEAEVAGFSAAVHGSRGAFRSHSFTVSRSVPPYGTRTSPETRHELTLTPRKRDRRWPMRVRGTVPAVPAACALQLRQRNAVRRPGKARAGVPRAKQRVCVRLRDELLEHLWFGLRPVPEGAGLPTTLPDPLDGMQGFREPTKGSPDSRRSRRASDPVGDSPLRVDTDVHTPQRVLSRSVHPHTLYKFYNI